MAVLVRMIVPDMDTAAYDRVSEYLGELIKKQSGFISHVAYPSPSGFLIAEVWESQHQFDNWFTHYLKPNVPGVQHEVIELHSLVQP
jgi:heme-degrading monooxygenase HmoA